MVGARTRWFVGIAALGALVGLGLPGVATAAGEDPPPLVISHRGASAEAPEHTFAAYDRAVEEHTDVLECDLQLTKDDVLVCVHDTTVDRTTGGTATGRVDSFTLAELRTMDFGSWFGPEFAAARIVPFEEQLRCYRTAAPGVQFYAETKAPAEYAGRMEPALVKLLRRLDLIPNGGADVRTSPVIIQSFDATSLRTVKQLAPSLPTALLWVTPPPASDSESTDVMVPIDAYLIANPGAIDQLHANGQDVHTWTVDDPAEIDQLIERGIDGIFSNQTATLRARVDASTGHAARPPVELERGCPGVAGTVTAASNGGPITTDATSGSDQTSARSDDATASGTTADSGSSWVGPVIAVVVVAGALALLGVLLARRRRA